MTIGKLNVILEVTPLLTNRQCINVIHIIEEGYKEDLKKLRRHYLQRLKSQKNIWTNPDKTKHAYYKQDQEFLIKEYLEDKKRLQKKYLIPLRKAAIKRIKKPLDFAIKHKKPLVATAATAAVMGGYAAYNSKRRHDEAKKKLGLK